MSTAQDFSNINPEQFADDKELYEFFVELKATGGKMYQNRNRDVYNEDAVRPKYYGRKPSNSLSRARARLRITQAELAARSGTTRRTIIAIENNQRAPAVYLAIALAQALDAKVEDIFHLPQLTPVPPSKH